MNISSRLKYGLFAFAWFVPGLLIWEYGTGFLRNYGGDVLVVGFLLWVVLTILPTLDPLKVAMAVFGVALIIEISQLFDLASIRYLLGEILSSLILGHRFEWLDLVAYAVGLMICLPLAKVGSSRLGKRAS